MKRIHDFIYNKLSVRIFIIITLCVLLPCTLLVRYIQADMTKLLDTEISSRIVESAAISEAEVVRIFTRMVNISATIFNDSSFIKEFKRSDATYYDRTVAFRQVVEKITNVDLFEYSFFSYTQDVKILLKDDCGRVYINWDNPRNYGLDELLSSPVAQKALEQKGFIQWDLNAPSIILNNGTAVAYPQIAMSRAICLLDDLERAYGYMLITVDQQQLFHVLDKYKYSENDIVFVGLENGAYLFENESERGLLSQMDLQGDIGGRKITFDDGRSYLVSTYSIGQNKLFNIGNLSVYHLNDYDQISTHIAKQNRHIQSLAALCLLTVTFFALFISRTVARPAKVLIRHINASVPGERPVPIVSRRQDEFGQIFQAYNRMEEHNYQLFENLRKEQSIRNKYYLESLKSKISPHFLFNTLNSIRWMAVIRNAVNIQQSIDDLAVILRYGLSEDTESVPLSEELSIVRRYCSIQEVRFGCSCHLDIDVPDACQSVRIIKFILQPTVENCFKHAFADKSGDNGIRVRAAIREEKLWITITDTGAGFPEQMLAQFRAGEGRQQRMNHLGIYIVDERIRIAYGEPYGLHLQNDPAGGACVEYCLPVNKEASDEARIDR